MGAKVYKGGKVVATAIGSTDGAGSFTKGADSKQTNAKTHVSFDHTKLNSNEVVQPIVVTPSGQGVSVSANHASVSGPGAKLEPIVVSGDVPAELVALLKTHLQR